MNFRTILAVAACKITRKILHLTGKGGTALPGKIAMAVAPDILLTVSRGMHIVLVTGTNGKTTTCRMLKNAIVQDGRTCLLNQSGANLLSGITAEFVCGASWKGVPRMEYAVVECDEGAFRQAAPLLHPEAVVVTNLFRDQLDRYGEVMNTREKIREGILTVQGSTLCLNADCSMTASLADDFSGNVLYYGVNVPCGGQKPGEISDAKYCIHCGRELEYLNYTYAHLGRYRCPSCGFMRPDPDFAISDILETGTEYSLVKLQIKEEERTVKIGLPAIYNLYNALACVCAGTALSLHTGQILKAVAAAEAPFGRMESFELNGSRIRMILVKNPAGCNQALDYVTGGGEDYGIVLCLNDRTADGHDISWIWDADFEKLVSDPHRKSVWVSGTRAEELQLRLKYAGAKEEEIHLEKDYSRLIGQIAEQHSRIYVLPNYTSMLDFRRELLLKTGGQAFWKG